MAGHQRTRGQVVGGASVRDATRHLPEETPVAITVNGTTQAVLMASPLDIEDFAMGFAVSEGIVARDRARAEVERVEAVRFDAGIEARLWVPEAQAAALAERRRTMLGPVGCGLCGIESLAEAMRPLPPVTASLVLPMAAVAEAPEALRARQPLHDRTRAVHAAGFLQPGQGLTHVREDVGRHNALDKLIGALIREGVDPGTGAVVLTSRVSIDMVQKTVMAGCPVLIAVSAPTAQAVRLAEGAGLTVAAYARDGGAEVFSHPQRIVRKESHVA